MEEDITKAIYNTTNGNRIATNYATYNATDHTIRFAIYYVTDNGIHNDADIVTRNTTDKVIISVINELLREVR